MRTFTHRIERDRARHLIVRPVSLQKRSQLQLLEHRHLALHTHTIRQLDRHLHHHRRVLLTDRRNHAVPRRSQGNRQRVVLAHPHATDVDATLGEVHAGRRTRQQRHCPRRLHRRRLDRSRNAEPVAVHFVPSLYCVITLIQPLSQLLQIVLSQEVRNATHRTTDTTVTEHHTVRLRPMRHTQCHCLRIQIRELQCTQILRQTRMTRRERLHQTTQLVRLQ